LANAGREPGAMAAIQECGIRGPEQKNQDRPRLIVNNEMSICTIIV